MIYPIEIKNLSFKYLESNEYILNKINMIVNRGEIVGIVGISGSGKSTLCNCLSGIIPRVIKGEMTGSVTIFGKQVSEMEPSEISKTLEIVFQDPDSQLFSFTVESEIAFGPENLCVLPNEIGERIKSVLNLTCMDEYRFNNPNNLSGGQKQLIAMASVLSLEPEILILDEVMSQIDRDGRKRIKAILKRLKEMGKTIIIVDHALKNIDIADKVFEIKDGIINILRDKYEK